MFFVSFISLDTDFHWFFRGLSYFSVSHTWEAEDELSIRCQPCWKACWKEQFYRRCFFPFLIRAPSISVTPPLWLRQASQMMASYNPPQKTPCVPFCSLTESMDAHSHSSALIKNSNLEVGWFQLERRHCCYISRRITRVKSEPDKSRVLSGICPACSCHLPGKWEEGVRDRGEFMTCPSNHKGGLKYLSTKHMGRKIKSKGREWCIKKKQNIKQKRKSKLKQSKCQTVAL